MKQVFDHFSFLAPFYERVLPTPPPGRLVELTGLPVDGKLLDAGGGTGRVAQSLVGLAADVIVVDLSLGMLRQTRTKRGLRPVSSQSEALPFPEETFDRVIMVDALHHVCSQVETAGELWRVVKRGGRIVIEEPDIRTLIIKGVALLEKLALMRSHFLSPSHIAALFPYPGAQVRVEREGYNAWIVVNKTRSP